MASNRIAGYKKVFGLILPDWVDERVLNVVVGYVLVSVVMMFVMLLVINPNKDTLVGLEAGLEKETEALNKLRDSRRSLDQLSQDVTRQEQESVFRAMPLEYSPEEAVFSLRKVANEAGVSILEYSLPSGVVFEDGVKQFTKVTGTAKDNEIDFKNFMVQVTLEGPVRNILEFTKLVQRSLPIAMVSDLSIQEIVRATEAKVFRPTVNMKLSVQYFQPVIKGFNVARLQDFTEDEIATLKELEGYALSTLPSSFQGASPSGQISGDRDLFGQ